MIIVDGIDKHCDHPSLVFGCEFCRIYRDRYEDRERSSREGVR